MDLLGSFALYPLGFAGAGILASVLGESTSLITAGLVGTVLILLGLTSSSIRGTQ